MVDVLLSSRDLMSLVLLEKDRQRFKGALLQWTQLRIVFAVLTVSWTQPGPRPDAIKIFLPSIDSSLEFKHSCRLKMVPWLDAATPIVYQHRGNGDSNQVHMFG